MVDHTGLDLVPPHQPGEDGQSGRIGAGPACRTQGVRGEIEDRAAACSGLTGVPPGVEQLVQHAGVGIDHQRVPVGAPLDLDVGPERVRPGVALPGVAEVDRHIGMCRVDHVEGDAVGRWPEVGMQVGRAGVTRALPDLALRVLRQHRDVHVPDVVGREDLARGGRYRGHRHRDRRHRGSPHGHRGRRSERTGQHERSRARSHIGVSAPGRSQVEASRHPPRRRP